MDTIVYEALCLVCCCEIVLLGQGIDNDQLWLICIRCFPGEELDVIRAAVIVVIFVEAQAELRNAVLIHECQVGTA